MLDYCIVIGGSHFNSLGLIRSLGEKRIKSVFICDCKISMSVYSKYTIKTVYYSELDQLCDIIKHIVNEFGGKPGIFPSSDSVAKYLDDKFSELKHITYCPSCNGNMSQYMDKFVMSNIMKNCGFNIPESITINIDEDGIRKIKDFGLPCIVKPLASVYGNKMDIKVCQTNSDLDDAIDWLLNKKNNDFPVLLQRFVDGENNLMIEYCGCKVPHKSVFIYGQLEKIREYPTERGSTSYAKIKKYISYIDLYAIDNFLDKVKFCGIFDLEFKVVDGIPYFLEINFRNGAPGYAFTHCGFNIPYVWYKVMSGRGVPEFEIIESNIMCEGIDFRHVMSHSITFFTWFKQFLGAGAHMIINRKDLKPLVVAFAMLESFFKHKF